ncbi:carbohydrate kinase family protein [Pseudodesulfovibrio thermohalotolerans]|uniref:carbohydrate kinase family protein n=1 Tax=Pseudodesulfovibrio thermohalotolerans TaxID=2880651 RepID=UPI0022B9F25D|nr:carbohydrate kinase family protein [Pseudodesulfovibrio thermohalotolerans]WFS61050.1 carbohydrate kinase family protein [Pseudodesulfovibrio thermohalotolerans]
MQIYISGSLAFDRIMTFPDKFSNHILPDKIHILNVSFLVNGLVERFGGTAGNIAYNLSLLGVKSTILSQVGKDFAPYDKRLQEYGLAVDGIRTIEQEFTAGCYITTDMSDNQINGFNPGAMKYPCQYDMSRIDSSDAIGLIAPGNINDMLEHPRYYREQGIPYIFDPGQQIPALSGDQLKEAVCGAEILIVNDYELEMIKKSTGMTKAELLENTAYLITTLGENGSIVSCGNKDTAVGVVPASEVLDPTGAGDAYRAGLLKGLSLGKTVAEAAKLGATCATYAVEFKGTQEHSFSLKEFTERYESVFGPLE